MIGNNESADVGLPKVTGSVSYSVYTHCPHCSLRIDLNDYPYTDDTNEDFGRGEDELGMAVFGSTSDPAIWNQCDIQFKCCHCKQDFILDNLEM